MPTLLLPLAQIPSPPRAGIEIGPIDLRMYGVLIAIGAFLALQFLARRSGGILQLVLNLFFQIFNKVQLFGLQDFFLGLGLTGRLLGSGNTGNEPLH